MRLPVPAYGSEGEYAVTMWMKMDDDNRGSYFKYLLSHG